MRNKLIHRSLFIRSSAARGSRARAEDDDEQHRQENRITVPSASAQAGRSFRLPDMRMSRFSWPSRAASAPSACRAFGLLQRHATDLTPSRWCAAEVPEPTAIRRSAGAAAAERYGTPMAQTLRVMAQENRDMRMSEAERRRPACREADGTEILFFLPVLFIVILGPAAIRGCR